MIFMEILTVVCSAMAILISLPAIAIAVYTLVEIKAFQRSTHKVEFMPVPTPSKSENREFLEGFGADTGEDFLV
jgi:hypothetical protein